MNTFRLADIFFCIFIIPVVYAKLTEAQDTSDIAPTPIHVGVILDMETYVGKVSTSCMYMAISDFYAIHGDYKTRLLLQTRDSKVDVIGAAFAAMDLLENTEVQVIIGPQKSSQTEFIVDLGEKFQIPILSFSATIPSIYSRSPYFIRTIAEDHNQVKALASIVQAFKWRKIILIHEDTDYGNRLVPHLINAFQDINTRISYRSVISPYASDDQIFEELQKLVAMQISIFVLHMSSSFGSRFFLLAKERGMMTEGYAWIVTNGLMNVLDSLEPNVLDSMQGVLGLNAYIPRSTRLNNFLERWKQKFIEENLDIENAQMVSFGLHAYDTIWALAMAVEKVGYMKSNFKLPMKENIADLLAMEVSQTGPKLLEEITKLQFKGLSGDFRLVKGQLQPSAFQILNVIGKRGREIGFWTSDQGISGDLNLNSDRTYSVSADNFRDINWPGESPTVPKGWVIPMNGKKLRIGVPVQDGFSDLVNVTKDPHTNATIVSSFSIDVFKNAIAALPYTIPYEFVPFHLGDNMAGSYNDLIHQVYIQNYDAVVGDVTITANRSLYVDFAFPYTDGGVWMIVPFKRQEETAQTWMFLQSITKDLGRLSMTLFIIVGFLVWFMEQGHGEKFRGISNFKPVRKILNMTSSTITLENRKKLTNILSKLMVIIWLFLILGLMSNYVVTLTSILTPVQLDPAITDFNELITNGDFVGYREGTFIVDLLKRFHFDESKLKPYSSFEECNELLSKGSRNGGVAAVFDEMPYINFFLARYCPKYTKVGPTHKTDGFGFVFPLGSPLVSDISKAVLEVTEGNKLTDIEQAWFEPNTTCEEDGWSIFMSLNSSKLLEISVYVLILSILITSSTFKDKQSEIDEKKTLPKIETSPSKVS